MADAQTPVLTDPRTRAVEILRAEATSLRECHTIDGQDWTGEDEAKAAHDEILAVANALAAQAPAQPDRTVMQRVRDAITAYHLALDQREHGGVAAGRALEAIQDALGMPWIQGAALTATLEATP